MCHSLVSIVTPAYNSEKYIGETIVSVLNQTYTNWELLVVDDFSTDRTFEIVTCFAKQDKRIRLIKLNENVGSAEARNVAFQYALGRYIAFLDSDDLWLENKLENQISFMSENDIVFSYTYYRHVSEDLTKVGKLITGFPRLGYNALLHNAGCIGCLTVVIDRNATGCFKMLNLRIHQDYLLWLEILRRGFIATALKEDLARYRVVKHSVTRNKFKAMITQYMLFRNVLKLSIMHASYCQIRYIYGSLGRLLSLPRS